MVEGSVKSKHGGDLFLPPGFRFHPTDEEIITSYLLQKFLNPSFAPRAMGEVDLNKCEPWDLPCKAKMGEKEWYFFCHKDIKYPNGMRTNRATKEGYWKATGKDREIFKKPGSGGGREVVGMKKTLVFYMGRAPKGSRTNWVMHEFRIEGNSRHNNANLRFNPKDEWVVCKVYQKGQPNKDDVKEYSAATPNVSSVEAAGEVDDELLVDSMIGDPMYFNSAGSFASTMNTAASLPCNLDYPIFTTAGATARSNSFVDLPTSHNPLHQQVAAMANSAAPTKNSSSCTSPWDTLHGGHQAMGRSYNLHDQAMVAKARGRAISPNFTGGLPIEFVGDWNFTG
ncbi:hypothetical protein BS78_08G012900 [Paspalum vaginatum]|nr:hypothetical protein BS78_08G012900 [Paspalum vaginatum]